MRTGVVVHLSPTDRKRLRSIVDDRNSLQKHVWRARIVLARPMAWAQPWIAPSRAYP
jgi:hypothetical protein